MPDLTPSGLRTRLAARDLPAVCLLLGDDEGEKRALVDAMLATIDEQVRLFNVDRFDADDAPIAQWLDAAQTLPVMAERRLIVVARAERRLQPARESRAGTTGIELLETYLEAPAPHAALVLVAGDLDERRRIVRRLVASAEVVRCGELADASDARAWIAARLVEADRHADPDAVRLLADVVGPAAGGLRGALDRLMLYAGDASTITSDDVRTVVGASGSGPNDDWGVARAIEQRDTARALREVALALDAGAVPYMLLGQLAWVARSRLDPARTGPAVDAVFRTDKALKQSGGEPRVLLERLVVQLCGAGRANRR